MRVEEEEIQALDQLLTAVEKTVWEEAGTETKRDYLVLQLMRLRDLSLFLDNMSRIAVDADQGATKVRIGFMQERVSALISTMNQFMESNTVKFDPPEILEGEVVPKEEDTE